MPYNNTPIAPAKEITGHVSLPLARVQKIITADPNHLTVSKNASFAIALATEMFIQHLATTTHNVVKAERKPRRNIQYRDVSSAVAKTDNLEFLVDVVPRTTTWGAVKKGARGKKEESKGKAVVAGDGKAGEGEEEEVGDVMQSREEATLEERIDGQAATAANGNANSNGSKTSPTSISTVSPPQAKPADDAMDVDPTHPPQQHQQDDDRVQDSEPEDEDPAAMQIEMEMRGPPRPAQTASPEVRRSSGFTAINGAK
ncbi:hypothetical protein NX059_000920 [Plenodomus lindquistii]|nr:hypothetical protein NX059_000920 [Plenodomus lindquistii]